MLSGRSGSPERPRSWRYAGLPEARLPVLPGEGDVGL